MRRFVPEVGPLQEKFATTRQELAAKLIERDDDIDLILTALIAQEHVLLVGPPGSAKSLLLDSVLAWTGGKKFSILLTKFSSVEEVFGPVSVMGLKEDRYRRITTGKLPEADFAFIDEIFKSSSAILNTLLKILNERTYDNGDGLAVEVPLRLCVAASNEWVSPETGKELSALFDRFCLRKSVRSIVSSVGRQKLLWERDHIPKLSTSILPEELKRAHDHALGLTWTETAKDALENIVRELAREGIWPGDRRQFKAVKITQAFAWLHGAEEVEPEHLEILQHVLWEHPQDQPEKCAQVIAKVANPIGMRIHQLLLEVEQILNTTDIKKLTQAAAATAKLGEIEKQLLGMRGNGRLERARAYVKDQIRKIRLASIEAV